MTPSDSLQSLTAGVGLAPFPTPNPRVPSTMIRNVELFCFEIHYLTNGMQC